MLTVGSLFAGVGGFDLGLERAGMRSVWQCEIDPFCQRVLARHWPDVLRLRDVRDVTADTVPAVDVICGGFPCQDLSLAGKGAGLAGARSGLWSEYVRVVGELRPRYVIVENVRALLARGLDRVLGDLAALGYDAEWDCIPASAVGAPHQRDRIWVVAYATGRVEPTQPQGDALQCRERPADGGREQLPSGPRAGGGDGRGRDPQGARGREPGGSAAVDESDVADADEERRDRRAGQLGQGRRPESQDGGPRLGGPWPAEPGVGRVAHGVPDRSHRVSALGNALVPQIAEWIGQRIVAYEQGELRDAA